MSHDYSNREDWLMVRNSRRTARARPARFIFVSDGGNTYNVGRNKAKRAKKAKRRG